MSSGPQACRDDEDEWDRLSEKLGISQCNWKVYSIEYNSSEEGFTKDGLTGILLEKFVSAKKILNQAQVDFDYKLRVLLQASTI
jgi:hypothetical protein